MTETKKLPFPRTPVQQTLDFLPTESVARVTAKEEETTVSTEALVPAPFFAIANDHFARTSCVDRRLVKDDDDWP